MKTTKLIAVFILTFAFIYAFTGCGDEEVKDNKHKSEQIHDEHSSAVDTSKIVKEGSYFCPMHPLVQSNEPAKCPDCKMDCNKERR
jgi:hypothetical protein